MILDRVKNSRGSGLVLSLLSLIVFFVLAATLVVSLRSIKRESIYQQQRLVAQSIAESGIEDAIAKLQADSSWHAGFTQKTVGIGYYTVSLPTSASTPAETTITSTGYGSSLALLGRPAQAISVTVEPEPIPRMNYGLFTALTAGGYDINLKTSNNYVDAYNSETSTSPSTFLSSATIWSNHGLSLSRANYSVYGSASFLSGSTPGSNTTTSGVPTKAGSTQVFLSTAPGGYATTNDNLTGLQGGAYNSGNRQWTISSGSTGTLTSGVYYLDTINIQGTLLLNITNGPVVIFLSNDFNADFAGTSVVNPTGVPGNFILYGPTSGGGINVNIQQSAAFYGVILGPTINANINSVVYGAIGAKAITLDTSGSLNGIVHQDLSLQRAQLNVVRIVPNTWTLLTKGS